MQRLSRRHVLRLFAAAGAMPQLGHSAPTTATAQGYGTDPKLAQFYKPGDVWPLTLSAPQRRTVTTLCDLILPADDLGPAASTLGVPELIDEWVSAPYPTQKKDRPIILDGLDRIDKEATTRYHKPFAELDIPQQRSIADDICDPQKAKPEFATAAIFFQRLRSLASIGYYTTQEGWKAIGFVGNITTATFDGPPAEVLKLLDVEQTVD